MKNVKFILNNFKSYVDLNNKQVSIIAKKKFTIITEPYSINYFEYDILNTENTISLYCCISQKETVNKFTKYILWESSFCDAVYKYILLESTKLKTKYKNKMIPKYIITKKWNKCHYIKNLIISYKHINNSVKGEYTKIRKNIILNSTQHKSNIVFSSTIISQLKKLIDTTTDTDKHKTNAPIYKSLYKSLYEFIRNVFNYKDELHLLNENTLKILLKTCSSKHKISLLYILLDNKIELYIKQKMEFHSIRLEMNEDTKTCYIYTLWNEMEKIIC